MNILMKKINCIKMTDNELQAIGCTDIEEIISEDFGTPGTPERDRFDR